MTESQKKEDDFRKIPYLQFSGTHFSCFEKIGKQFSDLFKIAYDTAIGPMFEKWCQSFPNILDKFIEKITTSYPTIDQEIKGLASGSGMTYKQIFAFNIIPEMEDWNRLDFGGIDPLPKNDGHCSDIIVNQPKMRLIGHNEDNDPEQDGSFFLLDVTILDEKEKNQKERILYFMFPAILPGWSYGFNSHGIVMSGNSLTPRKYEEDGTPFFAITRSCISAKSINECTNLILKTPKSFGFALNISSTKEKGRMICCEFCPHKTAIFEIPKNCCFSRTNNYEILKDPKYLTGPNSKARKERMDEIIKMRNGFKESKDGVKEIREVLGDEKNEEHPVFVRKGKRDGSFTNSTAIFDVDGKKLFVFSENPKFSEPVFVFDLDSFKVLE